MAHSVMEEWETFGLESTGEGRLGEKETVGWKAEGRWGLGELLVFWFGNHIHQA